MYTARHQLTNKENVMSTFTYQNMQELLTYAAAQAVADLTLNVVLEGNRVKGIIAYVETDLDELGFLEFVGDALFNMQGVRIDCTEELDDDMINIDETPTGLVIRVVLK